LFDILKCIRIAGNSIAESPRSVVDQVLEQLNSIQIDIWQAAVKKLHTLTEDVRNHVHIAEAGVIPLLPVLLRQYTSMEIRELVVSCLENIVIHNKDLLLTSPKDCFEPLFQTLRTGSPKVQEKVAAILALLPGLNEYAGAICEWATVPTLWTLAQSGSPEGKVNAMFTISRIVIDEDKMRHKLEARDGAHPLQSEHIPNVDVVPPVAKLVKDGMLGAQGSVGIRAKCLSKVYDIVIVWEDAHANHLEDTKLLEEHLISVLEIGTKMGGQFAMGTLASLAVAKALPGSPDDIITGAAILVIKRFGDAIIQKQTIQDVVEMFKDGDLDERVMAVKVLWDISSFETAEMVANTLDNPETIATIIDKVKTATLQEKLNCVTVLEIIALGTRVLDYLQ
jgi:hypothetical protein